MRFDNDYEDNYYDQDGEFTDDYV